jgi:hypothetical protein
MNNPTRCTSFAIVLKNQNWLKKITSFLQVKEKNKMISKLENMKS